MISSKQTLFQTPTVVYLSNLFLTCLTQNSNHRKLILKWSDIELDD